MSRRLKSTPFARFFVAMLIIAPMAFIGASYMNGQDGLQQIKNFFTGTKTEVVKDANPNEEMTYQLEKLEEELEDKDMRIEELLDEIKELKSKNEALEQKLDGSKDMQ